MNTSELQCLERVPFQWGEGLSNGSLDCLGFANLVREHYGEGPLWFSKHPIVRAYQSLSEAEALQADQRGVGVLRIAKQLMIRRSLEHRQHLDLLMISSVRGATCLGTLLTEGIEAPSIALMYRSGSRVIPWTRVGSWRHQGIFDPRKHA